MGLLRSSQCPNDMSPELCCSIFIHLLRFPFQCQGLEAFLFNVVFAWRRKETSISNLNKDLPSEFPFPKHLSNCGLRDGQLFCDFINEHIWELFSSYEHMAPPAALPAVCSFINKPVEFAISEPSQLIFFFVVVLLLLR